MLFIVAQAFFFFLPAFFANMMPLFAANIKCLKRFDLPIDFGKKCGNQTIFGAHKTYRGFIAGVLGAILVAFLQTLLYQFFPESRFLFLFEYNFGNFFLFGFLLGFGALLGDLMKSFFKRRLNIQSGASFFPFDQLDFVIGGLALNAFYFLPSWKHMLALIILTPLFHFLANVIAYKMKWKQVWW